MRQQLKSVYISCRTLAMVVMATWMRPSPVALTAGVVLFLARLQDQAVVVQAAGAGGRVAVVALDPEGDDFGNPGAVIRDFSG